MDVPLGGFIIAVLTIVPNVLKLEYYAKIKNAYWKSYEISIITRQNIATYGKSRCLQANQL